MNINFDKTFCANQKLCDKRSNCMRNYVTLVGKGATFPRLVSMADFYHENLECEYYIEEDSNGESDN